MKKLLLWITLLLSCPLLYAHGHNHDDHEHQSTSNQPLSDAHISGDVRDANTGEHLPYVYVTLKNRGIGGLTDASGHFYITNVPTGKTIVEFSMLGYETIEYTLDIVSDSTYILRPELKEESIMLNNIVVSGNKYETKQKETASMVNVISPTLIKQVGAENIGQVLDYQTGLRLEETCQNCGAPSLRINGLEGQYTQILMDSRPIFSSLASVYGLEQIPTGMVDRIEVIRGGGSALFGGNAVAGVVNIITKEPKTNSLDINHTTSLVGGKAWDFNTNINGTYVTSDSKIGVSIFGTHHSRDAYDADNDGFSELCKLNNATIGFRSFFKTGLYSKITAEYHHMYEFRRGGDSLELAPDQTNITEQTEHNIDTGSLQFDWTSPNKLHHFSIYSSAQYIKRNSYYGTDKNPNAYGNTTDITAVVGGQYRYSWMQNTVLPADVSAGIEYTYDNLHDQMLGYDRDMRQEVNIIGGYLQNEWKNKYLSILIGARLDKHNLMNQVVCSPRASIRYTPIPEIVIRGTYSSGYRAPQAYDEDLHIGAVGGEVSLIELDPNLRPEYSHSVSLSTDLYKDFGLWETNLTLEGFFTQINDVFTLVDIGHDEKGNLIRQRTNSSGAYVGGLNVEAKVAYSNIFSFQLGYTFQQSRYKEAVTWSENPNIKPQTRMFRTPDHYGYAIATVTPVKGFDITINGKATGSMLVQHAAGYIAEDEEVETPTFWDLGVKLSYDIPLYKLYTLQVNAGVKNVLNSFQTDFDKGPSRDSGYIYGPTLPRTFFVGLNLKL